ncbi:MAG: sodium:solute symporter family transporter [Veillonella sp.]
MRNHTEVAQAATLPDYLKVGSKSVCSVAVISALFILIFFLIYTSSDFGGGKIQYHLRFRHMVSLFITGIVVFYTFLRGFLAVSWTDCIQE